MKTSILSILLIFAQISFGQIDDERNKSVQQLDGIVPGSTNLASRAYLDQYVFSAIHGIVQRIEHDHYNTYDYTSIATAITDISSDSAVLYFTTIDTLNANLTIPANILFIPLPGSRLTINDHVLTIDGMIAAEPHHWIDISLGGSVNFDDARIDHGYIEWWGAAGDGVTNDSLALYHAIVDMDGKQLRLLSGKSYLINSDVSPFYLRFQGYDIDLTTTGKDKATIIGEDEHATTFLLIESNNTWIPTLSQDAFIDSFRVTVSSTSNLVEGMLIELRSDSVLVYNSVARGELNIIDSVDVANKILRLRHPLLFNYDVSNEDVQARCTLPINVRIDNIAFIAEDDWQSNANNICIEIWHCQDLEFTRNYINGWNGVGVQLHYNHSALLEKNYIINVNQNGGGYGIHSSGGNFIKIYNNEFYNCRSGMDAGSRVNRFIDVQGNYFGQRTYLDPYSIRGAGFHEGVMYGIVKNNTFDGCQIGFTDRSLNSVIDGNQFRAIRGTCISKNGGHSITITNNVYNYQSGFEPVSQLGGSSQNVYDTRASLFINLTDNTENDTTGQISIIGNTAIGITEAFISIGRDDSLVNFKVLNNNVYFERASGNVFFILSGTEAGGSIQTELRHSTISGNTVHYNNVDMFLFNENVGIDSNTTFVEFVHQGTKRYGALSNQPDQVNNPNAIFELFSKTKGFLPPRMTTTQRNTLAALLDSEDEGMLVYDTSVDSLKYWNGASFREP